MAMVSGRGRVDLRFAEDNDGELYVLTKSDGMIRKVIGATAATTANAPASTANHSSRERRHDPVDAPVRQVTRQVEWGVRAETSGDQQ
jgi:hypothetical protein